MFSRSDHDVTMNLTNITLCNITKFDDCICESSFV
jgi:hypothetical protein